VGEAEREGEALLLAAVPEGVTEGLAPLERVAEGEALRLLLRLTLLLGL
jgi:hypothetical protein